MKKQENNILIKNRKIALQNVKILDFSNYKGLSDIELIKETLNFNPNAFGAIVDRYSLMIYKFAWLYFKNEDDSRDIAQETFIRAWKNIYKFDINKNLKTWLFAIAKNTSLDLIKKKKPIYFSAISDDDDQLSSFFSSFSESGDFKDDNIDKEIIKSGLYQAMEKISPIYKTVISLRYIENLKFIEIAQKLNESIDTIKSRHRRGLFALKKVIIREDIF